MERSQGSGPDHIGYNALTQAATRGIVRAALDKAARHGLSGDHHFYVTFRTHQQGVQMDDALKDRFPEEMTIVIQHQYTGFAVQDDRFEIVLSFGGKPQLLRVPFGAVTRFVDPSVSFGVQIEPLDPRSEDGTPSILPARLDAGSGAPAPAAPDATVVSLDAFRRK